MTGCRYNAKNSLDKNYLYLAKGKGAEILAEHEVIDVTPLSNTEGYRVVCKNSTGFWGRKKEHTAKGVIFSGGVLGTVKLLLKLKASGSLPNISDQLGKNVRTNNETLISISTMKKGLDFSKGLAIGSILHTDDNSHLEVCRYSSGSDFWKLLHLPHTRGGSFVSRVYQLFGQIIKYPWIYFKAYWLNSWSRKTAILLFMQSINSTLEFKKGIFGRMGTSVGSGKPPSAHIPESEKLVEEFSKITKGKASNFALETLAGIPSTAHILGGAVMGANIEQGVINKNNQIFGYKNLYVIDGSMISSNPGVNPSLTITAIAEHAMDQV